MRLNKASSRPPLHTHEGGTAVPQRPEVELERAVSTCLLWEDTFYERGLDIVTRTADLCTRVDDATIQALAIKARTDLKLRHVPLWLALQLVRKRSRLAAPTIEAVVQRPDELTELLFLYWRDGRRPLAAQLKKGLARAFPKFGAYSLAKWDRNGPIRLRDVMFLVHPKPRDEAQGAVWKQLVDGTLPPPDTWEVALSAGQDKKETWTRLLREKKLGDVATLMNVRNMVEAGVDLDARGGSPSGAPAGAPGLMSARGGTGSTAGLSAW